MNITHIKINKQVIDLSKVSYWEHRNKSIYFYGERSSSQFSHLMVILSIEFPDSYTAERHFNNINSIVKPIEITALS